MFPRSTPQRIVVVLIMALLCACLVAVVLATPVHSDVQCKTPTPTKTPKVTLTVPMTTIEPPKTATPRPTARPTSTPPPERPGGQFCCETQIVVCELFPENDWRLYHTDPGELERHLIKEGRGVWCVTVRPGLVHWLLWSEGKGHAGANGVVRIRNGNTVWVKEKR